ncbi:alcohol oxidase [Fomes fomentarius]|nr:alcohol oxidase [Fomes fomentarius]
MCSARGATFLLLGSFVTRGWAKFFSDPADLPAQRRYDYIVVGAGPGGSTIASRLSEDPGLTVLLIEAGPTDKNVTAIEVPYLAYQLQPNTAYNWNYTTTPQPGLNGRTVAYPRGRVLGGSSSINGMIWTRGSRDDFDEYARISGDAMQRYFKKVEHLVPPTDHHNTTGQVLQSIHGHKGPVNITVTNSPVPDDPYIIASSQELSGEFGYNVDMNSGNPLGIGWAQTTSGNGVRASASSSYIHPVLSLRTNLDVLTDTTVTKLIQTGVEHGNPAFRGVLVTQHQSSPTFALNATREVILSAGTINTPQILLLSGIGPSSSLRALNITTLVEHPHVGQHLSDHPYVGIQFSAARAQDDLSDAVARNQTLFDSLFAVWQANRTGLFAKGASNQIGWFRMPDADLVWHEKGVIDPSAGRTSPHYELTFKSGWGSSISEPIPPTGYFMSMAVALVAPSSRGSITLTSTHPFVPPAIDPNFLTTSLDVYILRTAIRAAVRFVSTSAFDGFLVKNDAGGVRQAGGFASVDVSSDESVDKWAREQASAIWHPVGTVRMGMCEDGSSVVDPDLRVKGVEGLRVVDGSVLPFIPAAHPQAVIYVIAERAADLIKLGRRSC